MFVPILIVSGENVQKFYQGVQEMNHKVKFAHEIVKMKKYSLI